MTTFAPTSRLVGLQILILVVVGLADYKSLYSWPSDLQIRQNGISVYHYLSINVACISLIISAFAVTFTDSPVSGRSPCSRAPVPPIFIYTYTCLMPTCHLTHALLRCAAVETRPCDGRRTVVRQPSHTSAAHRMGGNTGTDR